MITNTPLLYGPMFYGQNPRSLFPSFISSLILTKLFSPVTPNYPQQWHQRYSTPSKLGPPTSPTA